MLFVWGPGRIVPVRVTGLTITEKLYDPLLNPIHAEVQLTLRVLTPDELKSTTGRLKDFAVARITRRRACAKPGQRQPGKPGPNSRCCDRGSNDVLSGQPLRQSGTYQVNAARRHDGDGRESAAARPAGRCWAITAGWRDSGST